MALPTRATLRTNARARADQDSSDFPTDAQYNVYLDDAAREVWWDLRVAGWPVNFSSLTFTATGASFYPFALAGQVASIHGVYYISGQDQYPLHRVNEGNRASLRSTSFTPAGFAGFYDPRIDPSTGPGIELLPAPASGSYKVDYILEHPGFFGDSDAWYGPARSDSLVTIRAAYYAVKKEGPARLGEAQDLLQEYKEMLQKVTESATWFDARNPMQIRDVSSERSRFMFDYPIAGPDLGF